MVLNNAGRFIGNRVNDDDKTIEHKSKMVVARSKKTLIKNVPTPLGSLSVRSNQSPQRIMPKTSETMVDRRSENNCSNYAATIM